MIKTTLEELKLQLQAVESERKKNKLALNITLNVELIDYFLGKIDVFKFLKKVEDFHSPFNTQTVINLCNSAKNIDGSLDEKKLLEVFKKENIPNKVLNINEKRQLIDLYVGDKSELLEKEIKREAKEEIRKQEIAKAKEEQILRNKKHVLSFIKVTLEFLNPFEDGVIIMTKSRLTWLKKQSKYAKAIYQLKDEIFDSNMDMQRFLDTKNRIHKILNDDKKSNKKENNTKALLINSERAKTLEYHKKRKAFLLKEEEELLKKIEARKNGLLLDEDTNKKPSKSEPIIIEAYLDDFNSSRSRFVMAVMTANNINLSFHHGLIKLINEDENFEEIYFSSSGDILTFSNEKYLKDISINTLSNEKLNDILLKQTNNKYFIDNILNCLSIIHYINTFYNEKEKVEVSFENIESIKINDKINAENQKNKGIIYLSKSLNRNRIRTIKIKKGKRQIEGTFLIRGHWRRQKYLEGVKLIWIEPFWKGVGKDKKRVYKILKQTQGN